MNINRVKYFRYLGFGFAAILLVFAAVACTDHFDSLNTQDNAIVAEELDASLVGQAFAQSQYRGMYGLHWQFQIGHNLFSDLYAQYFATTAENFDSDQYVEVGRWIDLAWSSFYGDAAPQLFTVENFTEEEGLTVQNAVAKVWRVQLYHRISDYWGPIIYSEFGSGETSVPYDSQEDVYMDFFQTLDEAVSVLEQNTGGNAFGQNDLIYGGNVNQWLKFANSLRLRLAMRISYVEPARAQQEAEKAVAGGVMTSNADNAFILTTDNNRHPHETITNWGEFRMSATMQSILQGFDDPRISHYFEEAVDGGGFAGLRNGLPRAQKGPQLNAPHSDIDIKWQPIPNGGTNPDMQVMTAAEVYLLRAEGALKGWNMNGSARELYEEGIRTSLLETTDASVGEIEEYINSPNTPAAYTSAWEPSWDTGPVSDIPVAWDTSGDEERNLEQIITQKWLALYPDGWEAWSEKRRTKYPKFYPILESANPDISEDKIMSRVTFVDGEYSANRAATEAAVNLLNGPDANTTKLWWDAKN